ncbi:carboxypeptidase B-like [Frankliniella occidentalis]|uniref:Carboxypeptidase B-like n=1 Tax=Frankliniella occidentalis TaxID=133901 RepID=A0A6J1T0U0_FRAOC|nr:carboxypeptidase B-like [Frankliniella occidentalis]
MSSRFLVLCTLAVACAAVTQHNGRSMAKRQTAVPSAGNLSLTKYPTFNEVVAYLNALQAKHPTLVRVSSAGKSVEGRDIIFVRVSKNLSQESKPVMLVDALMHAREWITLPAVLYFLQQVVEGSATSLLDDIDLVVVPVLNPDGYEYSRTKDRLWRKNRNTTNKKCPGVDLNRNFDYHWADFIMSGGASDDPCDLQYAGGEAASEPETRNYQSLVRTLNKNKLIKMYVNLHSPEQAIFTPWGYSVTAPTLPDINKLNVIAKEANAAMVKAGAKSYAVENMAADYPSTGTVTDWVRGVAGVAQTFCLELPPGGDSKQEGFAVPTSEILPISQQVFQGLKVFAKYASKPLTQ